MASSSSASSESESVNKRISSSLKEGDNKEEALLYSRAVLSQKVQLPFILVGTNIEKTIQHTISSKIEGKCIVEGYVKPGSIKIINISSGTLQGRFIDFEVVFECSICCPVEGMQIKCYAKNITQAGIRAFTSLEEKNSPVIIYVSRDHHSSNEYFNSVKEKDAIRIRVIGQRFELNDKQVSIIGELLPKAAITSASSTASSASYTASSSQGQGPAKKKIIIRPNRQ
jgi:DNA-directed RNA polymerase subunit E'/Rpb7